MSIQEGRSNKRHEPLVQIIGTYNALRLSHLLNREKMSHGKLQAGGGGHHVRVRVARGGAAPDRRVRVRVRVLGAVRRCNNRTFGPGKARHACV